MTLSEVPGAEPRCAPDPGRGAGRLVVVRHGSTAWSRSGRHTGRSDIPLLPEGRQQARAVGRRLAGHSFSLVLVSPLLRARDTAELAGFPDAVVCDELREWDYGAYEGRTTAEICAERPGWSLWRDGVPGGETLAELARRAADVVSLCRAAGGDVLAFAHAHVLRVVAACWIELAAEDGGRLPLAPASIGILGWEHGVAALARWNDTEGDPLS